jgi:hypothetical protein
VGELGAWGYLSGLCSRLVDVANWQASNRQYNHPCLSKRPSNCRRFDFSFGRIAITAVQTKPDGTGRIDIGGEAFL